MKEALQFLTKLEKNNNRDWFLEHKKEYEFGKKQVLGLVEQVLSGIYAFDAGMEGLKPSSCMFRINRDVRFSANKNPYKNNMGAYMSKAGKKSPYAGYYLHIQPSGAFIAAGIWMPESKILNAIRQEIHFNHSNLRKILKSKDLVSHFGEMQGEQLKTSPKGFDIEHPAIDLLRFKSFVFSHSFTDKEVDSADFAIRCIEHYKAAYPFIIFLNEAVELGTTE
ncbi:MAG: DUF2461 domain-containing protein [Bacteroidia bacterium]